MTREVECPECLHRFDPFGRLAESTWEIMVRKKLEMIMDWFEWAELGKGGRRFDPKFGEIVLVDVDVDYDFENTRNPIYMVFHLPSFDEYYMAEGYADSYGNQEWSDRIRLVEPGEREVKRWARS